MLKKGDVILVLFILILVIVMTGFLKIKKTDINTIAVIRQNNNILRRINLDTVNEPEKIRIVGNYEETILVEKGRIRFEEANCPDKVCVKTGWLSKSGDTAVCIPNRTIIKIEGERKKVDGVAY